MAANRIVVTLPTLFRQHRIERGLPSGTALLSLPCDRVMVSLSRDGLVDYLGDASMYDDESHCLADDVPADILASARASLGPLRDAAEKLGVGA